MHEQFPSIRGFFRLDELLKPEELQHYSRGPVGLTFLNLGFKEIWQDPRNTELCEALSRALVGERDCAACMIQASPPQTTEPKEGVCVAGVHKTLAAVIVQGKPIGYVCGPQHPSPALYERDLTQLSTEIRQWLERHRNIVVDQEALLQAVGSTARRLSRRCALERRLRILRDTRTRFVAARDPGEVLDITCRALEALFGIVDICFYVLEEKGFLNLISARGPLEDSMPPSLKPEQGHVGRVIRERVPYYQPDLNGDSDFIHASPIDRARSAFTVPLPWFANEAPGALQAASRVKDHFPLYDRQAMQGVAEMAGLAAVKLFLKARSTGWRRNESEETWATIGLALIATPTDRPAEILAARGRLYRAMAEEALRISSARAVCVGIMDKRDNIVRAAASAGEGWTEEAKHQLARDDIRNAVSHVLEFNFPYDVPDTDEQDRFKAILPFTKSLYILPFSAKNDPVGVLSLSKTEPNAFTQDEKDGLKRLTDQFGEILGALDTREDTLFKQLIKEMDLKELTRESIEWIRRAFKVRSCSLFLKVPNAERVELIATTGPMPDEVHAYDYWEGLTGWVAAKQQPLRIRNTNDIAELDAISKGLSRKTIGKKWREMIADENHVFLAVPLMARQHLVGVMRLKVKEDLTEFTHEEETAVLHVASRLAAAIDDVLVADEAAEKVRQLEKEANLHHKIEKAETLQGTSQIMAEEFRVDTGAVAAAIIIEDSTPGYEARIMAPAGLLKGLTFDHTHTADGALGILPKRLDPHYDDHVGSRTEWRSVLAPMANRYRDSPLASIVSAATLPFWLEDKIFGVLLLCWNTRQNFDERGGSYLDALAPRAVTVLGPSALRRHIDKDLDHLVNELKRLREIGLGFAQNHDLDLLMQEILDVSLDESKMERGSIRFINQATSTLDLKAARNIPIEQSRPAIDITPFYGKSIGTDKCVFVPDVLTDSLWTTQDADVLDSKIRSTLHVPIRLKDECIGLILLGSSEVREVDDKARYYLEILSHYAAVAIDFARMRKELNRTIELAQPLAMMGTMLRGFLHEIRNRVNDLFAILGNIADTSVSLYMKEKTGEMHDELMRLHQVCNDLAHFTRTDPVSVSEEVSLNDLVERTLGAFSTRMREQGVTPENKVDRPSPVVAGNPIQLEIAFKMLIQNALEAMDQGGRLVVESARDSAFTRISFRDSGQGMDEATKAQCFEPFFTTKRDSGGTGLGLSVVFGIMARHDGRIEIKSAPRSGSTFTLVFPIKEELAQC